jgi:hypothetical protein
MKEPLEEFVTFGNCALRGVVNVDEKLGSLPIINPTVLEDYNIYYPCPAESK